MSSRYLSVCAAISLLWMSCPVAATAFSLNIRAQLEHESFVLYEPVTLKLKIHNIGGTPFIVDDYDNHVHNAIRVSLRRAGGQILHGPEENIAFGKVMVMSGEEETLEISLGKHFPLNQLGLYHMQVTVVRGEEVVHSTIQAFNIVNGIEIGSIFRPLPEYNNLGRRYSLLYWPRAQIEVLFLRIDELPTDKCVAFYQLGNIVRSVAPQLEYEQDGTLHIIHQSSRDLFIRTTISSTRDGIKVLERQRLLDPSQSPMVRSALLDRAKSTEEETPGRDGLIKRQRPDDSKP